MFDDLKKQTKEITMFQMSCHCKSKFSRGNYSLYNVKQTGSELKKIIFLRERETPDIFSNEMRTSFVTI